MLSNYIKLKAAYLAAFLLYKNIMIRLQEFKDFVDELKIDNSKNYKLSILEKYKDNESVKYFLDFVYNPFITTGLSDKKLNKNIDLFPVSLFDDDNINESSWGTMWLDYPEDKVIFEYVKEHNTGRDGDIRTVQNFKKCHLKKQTHLLDLFDKIITKNLQLGIDSKSINKILPNFIPTFNVMLANKYFDKPEVVAGKEFAITTKIDGGRIVAIKENGSVRFFTRQGQEYEGLVDLKAELENIANDNFVLDGELVAMNTSKEDTYKTTMKLSRTKDKEKHGLKMLVFDWLLLDDFKKQHCTLPYTTRRMMLRTLFYSTELKYFELLPILYQGSDINMISKLLDEQVSKGEEGVMINITDALYEFKRSNVLLKVKKMQTLDLEVVDYFEGSDSFKDMLGGFVVRYKDNNLVRVGSGFDLELRKEIWTHPQDYIGKIIEVQYFEETKNANGGLSIRFPVFKDIRSDKSEPDF